MAALPAITVDTLGNRSLGLPPLTDNPGTPADRLRFLQFNEISRRDPPGQWTDDRHQQARSFVNGGYIAVNAIMTAVGGSSAVVLRRRPATVAKSSVSSLSSEESEWSPVEPSHELARLFAAPNGPDFPDGQTFSEWLAEYVMCDRLFGLACVMWNPSKSGKPVELWNLRPNYLTAVAGLSDPYPRGSWRYYLPRPMLWGVSGQLVIPRERMVVQRRPHPLFPWDGYSPFAAGSKMVDFLNSVIDSRQMAMDRGLSVDALISLKGGSPDALEKLDARIREKYTGSNRGQKFMVTDGDQVSATTMGNTPDKMAYADSYKHGVEAVLALLGVPKECAFMAEGGSYSQFYASARAWRDGGLSSLVKGISERLTMSFIRPHWGDEYKIEIKLPPLMDPDQREKQAATLMNGKALKRNELRAMYDMKPVEGWDDIPDEAAAKIQQQGQPNSDPIAALLGGDPNAEPSAPGELDGPDVGSASEGSLPGAVSKSVKFSKPENYDKIKDLPEGRELWMGQNDWESGTTWAWVMDPSASQFPIAYLNVSHDNCPGCGGNLEANYTGDAKACKEFAKRKVADWLKRLSKGGPDAIRKAVDLRAYFVQLVEEVCA